MVKMGSAGCTLYFFQKKFAQQVHYVVRAFAVIPLGGVTCIFLSDLDVLLMTSSCLVCDGHRELGITVCVCGSSLLKF